MLEFRDPTLNEILADPIIRQVMVSDGVDVDDVRTLMRVHGREVSGSTRRPVDTTDRGIFLQNRARCQANARRP